MASPRRRFKSLDLTDDLLRSVDSDSLVEGYLDTSLPRELASSSSSLCLDDHEESARISTLPMNASASPIASSPIKGILKGAMLTSTPHLKLMTPWFKQKTLHPEKGTLFGSDKSRIEIPKKEDLHKCSLPVPRMDTSREEEHDTSSVFTSISDISPRSVASSTKRELTAMFDNYERTYRFKFSRFQRQLLQKEVSKMKSKMEVSKDRDQELKRRFDNVKALREMLAKIDDLQKSPTKGSTVDQSFALPPQGVATEPPNVQAPAAPSTNRVSTVQGKDMALSSAGNTNQTISHDHMIAEELAPRPIPPPRIKRNKALQRKSLGGAIRTHPYTSPSRHEMLGDKMVSPTRCALKLLDINSQLSPQRELTELQNLQDEATTDSSGVISAKMADPRVKCRRAKSFYSPLTSIADLSGIPNRSLSFNFAHPRRPAPPPPTPRTNTTDGNNNSNNHNNKFVGSETTLNLQQTPSTRNLSNLQTPPTRNLAIFEASRSKTFSTMFDVTCPSPRTLADENGNITTRKRKEKKGHRRSWSGSGNKIHPVVYMSVLSSGFDV